MSVIIRYFPKGVSIDQSGYPATLLLALKISMSEHNCHPLVDLQVRLPSQAIKQENRYQIYESMALLRTTRGRRGSKDNMPDVLISLGSCLSSNPADTFHFFIRKHVFLNRPNDKEQQRNKNQVHELGNFPYLLVVERIVRSLGYTTILLVTVKKQLCALGLRVEKSFVQYYWDVDLKSQGRWWHSYCDVYDLQVQSPFSI